MIIIRNSPVSKGNVDHVIRYTVFVTSMISERSSSVVFVVREAEVQKTELPTSVQSEDVIYMEATS